MSSRTCENTRREVDFIVSSAAIQPHSHILDLCCGQGRHCLELARRGFKHVMGARPLALSRAACQEAGPDRRPAGAVQGRRCAQPAAAGEQHRLRRHHGQLVRLLLQQAGRREGSDGGRQDPAAQRPARARHHRWRPHARALREALVGVDRRAPLRVPRALHQPGRGAPDLARGDRARRDGRHRRPVLRRAPLYAREHRQAAGEDRLPQRSPPWPHRGAVRPRPGPRHDGAPHPAVGRCAPSSGAQGSRQAAGARRHGSAG